MERFAHLVVANGIFSDPLVPVYEGAATFRARGGAITHSSGLTASAAVDKRHVVIIGHGKSACDIAAEVAPRAASVHVVARRLLWKMPRDAGGDFERIALTRLGEAMFHHEDEPSLLDRLLDGPARRLRDAAFDNLERRLRTVLEPLGLVPEGRCEEIARSTVSLEAEGFLDLVRSADIVVHRDAEVTRLGAGDDGPRVTLSNGQNLRADVLVCATGFRQRVPFLPQDVQERLVDGRGDLLLYRHIHPVAVSGLSFVGYNSSLISALNAEIAAIWVAAQLAGLMTLPAEDAQRALVARRLAWMDRRTGGRSAHGTSVVPFSIRNLDEMLGDLGVGLGLGVRTRQYLRPVDPASYRNVRQTVLDRLTDAAQPTGAEV